MSSKQRMIFLGFFACTPLLQAQSLDLNAIASGDAQASRSETLRVRLLLRAGSITERSLVREQLKDRLRTAIDPVSISRLSLAVAPACDDECVLVLVSKLGQTHRDMTDVAVLRSVQSLVSAQPLLKPATRSFVADTCESLARTPALKRDVVEGALVTLSGLGGEGFDRLVALRNGERNSCLDDVYFTLLAGTGDPRALPILRTALDDSKATDGRRSQALSAIGQLFRAARDNGIRLPSTEYTLCSAVIERVLADPASNQAYETAMQALANVNSASPSFQPAVYAALGSSTAARREAALSAIYAADQPVDAKLLPLIAQMGKDDPDEAVRAAAGSVLDKSGAVSSE